GADRKGAADLGRADVAFQESLQHLPGGQELHRQVLTGAWPAASLKSRVGWDCPFKVTSPRSSPRRTAGSKCPETASETGRGVWNCLVACSMRAARFTASPMIVYSLRLAEPTFPVTARPACRPMPSRVGGILFSRL